MLQRPRVPDFGQWLVDSGQQAVYGGGWSVVVAVGPC